jgi:hypothetical protein
LEFAKVDQANRHNKRQEHSPSRRTGILDLPSRLFRFRVARVSGIIMGLDGRLWSLLDVVRADGLKLLDEGPLLLATEERERMLIVLMVVMELELELVLVLRLRVLLSLMNASS